MPLFSPLSFLLRRRPQPLRASVLFRPFSSPLQQASPPPPPSPIPSLSARLSFVFDQIDSLENSQQSKTDSLLRLRHWHRSQSQISPPPHPQTPPLPPISTASPVGDSTTVGGDTMRDVLKKEVELVHPWPEWIELMQRLAQQKYFDFGRCSEEEGRVASDAGIDLSGIGEDTGLDFSRDWTTVRNACMNFGKDRFDLLRSLSRHDLQILVGHGCPSMDPKVVFSAKLLRKLVRLDEGDVCSSCNLRNSCNRGYILTRKEDEARTLDVMRILLTFSFDHVNGCVENKPLTKMKSIKTVIRKLLHEIVKLSAVPIDPNLPPPVIKKPPPKVKQPPPPPKKRVGRDDVEMKKGDWHCTKCDFMNFAKNIVCLKCDAERPKRKLLPGEWECPGCNFLNYRRNMVCHHCEHKRPPDSYVADQHQTKQPDPRITTGRTARKQGLSDAFNLDFDDNESDGADVAAFEFADPHRSRDALDNLSRGENDRRYEDTGRSRSMVNTRGFEEDKRHSICPRTAEQGRHFKEADDNAALNSLRTGFDDFDDEEEDDVDSYELEGSNISRGSEVARRNFSEIEESDSDGFDEFDHQTSSMHGAKEYSSDSEDDANVDASYGRSSYSSNSKEKSRGNAGSHYSRGMPFCSGDDNDDSDDVSASDLRKGRQLNNHRIRKGMGSDSDEFPFRYDSDDGDDLNSDGRRRGNDYGSKSSRKDCGIVERMNDRRASFGGRYDDRPPRGSGMHNGPLRRSGRPPLRYESDDGGDLNSDGNRRGNSGSRGSRKEFGTAGRMNNRRDSFGSHHDDRPPRGSGMHHGPSRRAGMDGKGPRGNGHSKFGQKDKFQQFDRQGDWEGSEFRQQRRRN